MSQAPGTLRTPGGAYTRARFSRIGNSEADLDAHYSSVTKDPHRGQTHHEHEVRADSTGLMHSRGGRRVAKAGQQADAWSRTAQTHASREL